MANDLSTWLARSETHPDIRFGHAQYHHHTLENVTLWKYLFAAHSSLDPVVVVASSIELIAVRSAAALGVQEGLLAFTYQEFLDFIEAKPRDGTGWDPQVWSEVWQSDHLTVMVAVEPHIPVDCALALTMVTHWVATRPSTLGVRILTVSTEVQHPEMVALLDSQGVPEPQRFLIPGLPQVRWKEMVQIVSCNESNLAERVKSTVMRNNGQQVVIYFHPTVSLLEVFRDLKEKGWLASKIDPLALPDQVSRLMTAGALLSRALHAVEEFRSPFPLVGFDHIHIVLSSTSSKKVFDSVSRQVTEVALPLSKQEKQEQLAWAYRWRGNPSTISVYIDHPSLSEFLDAGDPHRCLHVNNKQLGGFVSALASFKSWGIDPLRTARCFAPDQDVLMTTVGRLTDQKLLLTRETGRLGLRLCDKEFDVFKAALPVLGYDHRLAYFLAHSTSSPKVLQTKNQLFSLLAAGMKDLFHFLPDPTGQLDEDRDTLAAECWGYTRPLSHQGSMWMALGLWKLALLMPHYSSTNNLDIIVPGTRISVDRPKSFYIMETSNKLDHVLCRLNPDFVPCLFQNEAGELSEAECLELQRHLFCAFFDQLVVGVPTRGILYWQDVFGKGSIDGLESWVRWFVDPSDFCDVNRQSTDFVWGIYTGLSREGEKVAARDWTWIPPAILGEYDEQREIEGSF
ncbi:hypothetical protein CEP54_009259 [Fusarium duplospermum]|uniref:Uncharacterized protein n=1 Tax=Fusarium duplospermum TaxID=1325734 RepID=A0A428PRS4_9HYPO|nr:hypothetical protein CEP54_009259 [Fusarium duplospermum]